MDKDTSDSGLWIRDPNGGYHFTSLVNGIITGGEEVTADTIISTVTNPTAKLGDVADAAIASTDAISDLEKQTANLSSDGSTFNGKLKLINSDNSKIVSDGNGNLTMQGSIIIEYGEQLKFVDSTNTNYSYIYQDATTNRLILQGGNGATSNVEINGDAIVTGKVTIPTVSISDNSTNAATTEWVKSQNYNSTGIYEYSSLPSSPSDWQRVIITDKSIGSGHTGVMAMFNPIAKAWTGLSGESLN